MSSIAIDEARFALLKTLELEASDLVEAHPWFSEEDRWTELAFSILAASVNRPQAVVRDLVGAMASLELLEIDRLASLSNGEKANLDDPFAHRITDLMEEYGTDPAEARRATTALSEFASGLSNHFEGKAQRYLRRYGELMLDELADWFDFTTLDDAAVGGVFTYWLQNTLGMPLSLVDDDVAAFCKEFGVTPADLLAAADELDMNFALVDDVAQAHMVARRFVTESEGREDDSAPD